MARGRKKRAKDAGVQAPPDTPQVEALPHKRPLVLALAVLLLAGWLGFLSWLAFR